MFHSTFTDQYLITNFLRSSDKLVVCQLQKAVQLITVECYKTSIKMTYIFFLYLLACSNNRTAKIHQVLSTGDVLYLFKQTQIVQFPGGSSSSAMINDLVVAGKIKL